MWPTSLPFASLALLDFISTPTLHARLVHSSVPPALQPAPALLSSTLSDTPSLLSMANLCSESAILAATLALKTTPVHARSASLDFTS